MTGFSNDFEDYCRRIIATGMPGCMPQSDHEVVAQQPLSATGQYLRPILERASVKPKVVEVPCNFVGSFKVGDNLVYNCRTLSKLAFSNEDGSFNKVIILQVGGILEAALGQIIFRAQHFNLEGVPNISAEDQQEIVGKKIDKFNSVIDVLRKYAVLDELAQDIYDELHKLRKYRNKIHIQDAIDILGVSLDDEIAFSNAVCRWAIDLNFKVLSYLSNALQRPPHLHNYVGALPLPVWTNDDL